MSRFIIEKKSAAFKQTMPEDTWKPVSKYDDDFVLAAKDFWRKHYENTIDCYNTGNIAGKSRKNDKGIEHLFDSLYSCIKTAVSTELIRNKSNSTEIKDQLIMIESAFNLLKKDLANKEVKTENVIASIQGFIDSYIENVFTPETEEV